MFVFGCLMLSVFCLVWMILLGCLLGRLVACLLVSFFVSSFFAFALVFVFVVPLLHLTFVTKGAPGYLPFDPSPCPGHVISLLFFNGPVVCFCGSLELKDTRTENTYVWLCFLLANAGCSRFFKVPPLFAP